MIDVQLKKVEKIEDRTKYEFSFSTSSQNSNTPSKKNYYFTNRKRLIDTVQTLNEARLMLNNGETLDRVITVSTQGTSIILEDSEVGSDRSIQPTNGAAHMSD